EDDFGVFNSYTRLGLTAGEDIVVVAFELQRFVALGEFECWWDMGRDADEWHRLKPAAAGGSRLEAERFELSRDVMLSQLVAARAGAAAFEQVVGEEADVGAKGGFGDGLFSGGDLSGVGLKRGLRPRAVNSQEVRRNSRENDY